MKTRTENLSGVLRHNDRPPMDQGRSRSMAHIRL